MGQEEAETLPFAAACSSQTWAQVRAGCEREPSVRPSIRARALRAAHPEPRAAAAAPEPWALRCRSAAAGSLGWRHPARQQSGSAAVALAAPGRGRLRSAAEAEMLPVLWPLPAASALGEKKCFLRSWLRRSKDTRSKLLL